jgi:hypothetical protein
MKIQAKYWKKIFAKHISDKALLFKLYKMNSENSTITRKELD